MLGWRHATWAGTYSSRPAFYFKPENVEEVCSICRKARDTRSHVTVVGAGHSPSLLTMTSGWLVNLDKMDKVLEYQYHEGYTDVTVEAGIRLYQLNDELGKHGLALQNLGSITEQSIAGVISTGTHGSSAFCGLISQQYVELTFVNGEGEVVTCSEEQNPELFRALLLSLGKFGIIVRAVIRVVPAFNLESVQEVVSFDRFLDEIWPTFFTSAEYHRVWWYPYTDKCVLWRARKTLEPARPAPWSFYGTFFGRFLYQLFLWASTKLNVRWTPSVERWLFNHQFGLTDTYGSPNASVAVERSDKAMSIDCLFSQFVNEWALPLENGPKVLRELKETINERNFYVHAPFEIRASNTTVPPSLQTPEKPPLDLTPVVFYGNKSRPLLDTSPKLPYALPKDVTYGNLTLNLNATMYRPFGCTSKTFEWFSAFEAICSNAGGKPHWAKNFIGTALDSLARDHEMRGIAPDIESWYGRDLQTWKTLRRETDPKGIFLNDNGWMEMNGLD